MRLEIDACLSCGSHARSHLYVPSNCYKLNTDGTLDGVYGFWLCSVSCYKREVRKYLDKRYDFDVTASSAVQEALQRAEDDEWFIIPTHSQICERFNEAQEEAITEAVDEFIRRIHAEAKYEFEELERKEAEMEAKMAEREAERLQRERERQQAADERRREQERREAQRAADRADREAERREREQEKRDAEDRKRRDQEAEEAKWRPRSFEI